MVTQVPELRPLEYAHLVSPAPDDRGEQPARSLLLIPGNQDVREGYCGITRGTPSGSKVTSAICSSSHVMTA